MYSPAKSTVIPNYVRAKSPTGLRRYMLLNNVRLGAWHKYEIIYVESEKLWYAWFNAEAIQKDDPLLTEAQKAGE